MSVLAEVYRLTLTHYVVDEEGTKFQLDEPVVIEQHFDRRFGGSPIILNRMFDEMKHLTLSRTRIAEN